MAEITDLGKYDNNKITYE